MIYERKVKELWPNGKTKQSEVYDKNSGFLKMQRFYDENGKLLDEIRYPAYRSQYIGTWSDD